MNKKLPPLPSFQNSFLTCIGNILPGRNKSSFHSQSINCFSKPRLSRKNAFTQPLKINYSCWSRIDVLKIYFHLYICSEPFGWFDYLNDSPVLLSHFPQIQVSKTFIQKHDIQILKECFEIHLIRLILNLISTSCQYMDAQPFRMNGGFDAEKQRKSHRQGDRQSDCGKTHGKRFDSGKRCRKVEYWQWSVSRIERGTVIPNIIRLVELAEIFGCGTDELLMEASPRAMDNAKYLYELLEKLSDDDKVFLQEMMVSLAKKLLGYTRWWTSQKQHSSDVMPLWWHK